MLNEINKFKKIVVFYFILFYFILFYFILFYFILFYFILFILLIYFILFYFILFRFVSFYFILFYFIFCLLSNERYHRIDYCSDLWSTGRLMVKLVVALQKRKVEGG